MALRSLGQKREAWPLLRWLDAHDVAKRTAIFGIKTAIAATHHWASDHFEAGFTHFAFHIEVFVFKTPNFFIPAVIPPAPEAPERRHVRLIFGVLVDGEENPAWTQATEAFLDDAYTDFLRYFVV